MAHLVWHSIVHMNLFKSSRGQEPSDIKLQRWITYFYIVFLILALVILAFYLTLRSETKLVEITNPSLSIVKHLQQSQANSLVSSLRCPCAQLAVSYGEFVHLQPSYHQVCLSDFVSTRWVAAIART